MLELYDISTLPEKYLPYQINLFDYFVRSLKKADLKEKE